MTDSFLTALVLFFGLGGLFSAAYLLDRRGRENRPALPEAGPLASVLKWVAGVLMAVAVVSAIGAIVFRSMTLVDLAGAALGLFILDGVLYRILLASGK